MTSISIFLSIAIGALASTGTCDLPAQMGFSEIGGIDGDVDLHDLPGGANSVEMGSFQMEGDTYRTAKISGCNGQAVITILYSLEGEPLILSTSSRYFRTSRRAQVGDTFKEILNKYPSANYFPQLEGRVHYTLRLPNGEGFFTIDGREVKANCEILKSQQCRTTLDEQPAIKFTTSKF